MKKITLYGPTVLNDGRYVDAGATLTIGDEADQITVARSSDMVSLGTAVSETAAKTQEASAPEPAPLPEPTV